MFFLSLKTKTQNPDSKQLSKSPIRQKYAKTREKIHNTDSIYFVLVRGLPWIVVYTPTDIPLEETDFPK